VIWLLLAGMFLVTYLPRLKFFPYAALGALIFPGILTAVPGRPGLAAGAGVIAAICSLFIRNITVIVVLAIAVVLLLQNLGIP